LKIVLLLWRQKADVLQEVVHRKRNLDSPGALLSSLQLFKGLEKDRNQDKNQVLLGAKQARALANLAAVTQHLLS
jgi:hypothetical protein